MRIRAGCNRLIVRGKGFEVEEEPGKSLWGRVESVLLAKDLVPEEEAALLSGNLSSEHLR